MNDPNLAFIVPFGTPAREVSSWHSHSSFPSDHATLFFAISTGLLLVARKPGIFLLLYFAIVVGFARVYCGVHYPTDIIAGGLIGASVTLFMVKSKLRRRVSKPVLDWLQKSQATFYPVFFLLSYQMVILFNDVRAFGGFFLRVLRGGL